MTNVALEAEYPQGDSKGFAGSIKALLGIAAVWTIAPSGPPEHWA